jgi:P27 family predicted phage terminase small subunit
MPQVVGFNKMQVGKKGGGAHWTKDEVERRKAAAQKLKRKEPVKLKMPVWLDEEARLVWRKTLKEMMGFEILDNVDAETLAVYCDAVARYKELTLKIRETGYMTTNGNGTENISPYVKAAQSYARIILQYADKLGLSPHSRARLAKKIADESDPNADLFD